jgi:hypothetical protein
MGPPLPKHGSCLALSGARRRTAELGVVHLNASTVVFPTRELCSKKSRNTATNATPKPIGSSQRTMPALNSSTTFRPLAYWGLIKENNAVNRLITTAPVRWNNAANLRAINVWDSRRRERCMVCERNMKYVRRPSKRQSHWRPRTAMRDIEAGEPAPPIRSRGPSCRLCGPETWTWE